MSRISTGLLMGSFLLATIACDQVPASADDPQAQAPAATEESAGLPGQSIVGTVISTMDASNYTYVEVDTGQDRVWAAGPKTSVVVGETVSLSGSMPMPNFHSESLDRTFDRLYFVSAIRRRSQPSGTGASDSAPHAGKTQPPPEMDIKGIARAENGHTIAEVFEGRADLAGQEIAVRGVVVKVNAQILGRNWLHLQDGTVGPDGETNLIVTSSETAAVGSTVLVRGTLATDRDLGHGYHYDALIEEASVAVE